MARAISRNWASGTSASMPNPAASARPAVVIARDARGGRRPPPRGSGGGALPPRSGRPRTRCSPSRGRSAGRRRRTGRSRPGCCRAAGPGRSTRSGPGPRAGRARSPRAGRTAPPRHAAARQQDHDHQRYHNGDPGEVGHRRVDRLAHQRGLTAHLDPDTGQPGRPGQGRQIAAQCGDPFDRGRPSGSVRSITPYLAASPERDTIRCTPRCARPRCTTGSVAGPSTPATTGLAGQRVLQPGQRGGTPRHARPQHQYLGGRQDPRREPPGRGLLRPHLLRRGGQRPDQREPEPDVLEAQAREHQPGHARRRDDQRHGPGGGQPGEPVLPGGDPWPLPHRGAPGPGRAYPRGAGGGTAGCRRWRSAPVSG